VAHVATTLSPLNFFFMGPTVSATVKAPRLPLSEPQNPGKMGNPTPMSERTRSKRPKGQDSDAPAPGSAPAVFPLATEEGRGTKRHKTPVPIVAFRGTEKASSTYPPVSMTLPTTETTVPIVAFRGTERTLTTSPPVSMTLPTATNDPAASPNQLSSIVLKLNQRQAAESQVYTAVAAAIEAELARFAKSDLEPQRVAAQRLADALAVVFQSAIDPHEWKQAPSRNSSSSPSSTTTPSTASPPTASPPTAGPLTSPPPSDAGPKTFAAAAVNPSTRGAGLTQTIDISASKPSPKPSPRKDLRVFLRMPHLEPEVHLYAIREAVVRAAGISPTDLPDAARINSGYAVMARTEQIRDRLVAKTPEIIRKLSCNAVELPTQWHTYVVREVPKRMRSADGLPLLVAEAIRTEVETQTRQKPVSVKMSRFSDPSDEKPTASWLVSFLEPVSRPFRLFSQSWESVPLKKRSSAPKQCEKCCYWHGSRMCSNSALCLSCGHTGHTGECRKPTQCPNCKGPYAPAHTDCAARPVRKENRYVLPSRVELAGIRKMGQTAYTRANLPPRPSPTRSTQGSAAEGTTVPRTPSERATSHSGDAEMSDGEVDTICCSALTTTPDPAHE